MSPVDKMGIIIGLFYGLKKVVCVKYLERYLAYDKHSVLGISMSYLCMEKKKLKLNTKEKEHLVGQRKCNITWRALALGGVLWNMIQKSQFFKIVRTQKQYVYKVLIKTKIGFNKY